MTKAVQTRASLLLRLPAWLVAIVQKLHAKDPDERFQSAADVEQALRAGAESAALWPPPVVEPPPKLATRPIAAGRKHEGSVPSVTQAARTGMLSSGVRQVRSKWLIYAMGVAAMALILLLSLPLLRRPHRLIVVVGRDGENAGTFESLEDALDEAPHGARIEIYDNGPFDLGEIVLMQEELTLVAATNFQSVIRFFPEEEETALFSTEGELSLEGLELRLESNGDDVEDRYLVRVDEGEFYAERCRFIAAPEGCCVFSNMSSEFAMFNCELHAANGFALKLVSEEIGEASLENCILSSEVGVHVAEASVYSLEFDSCTVVAHRVLELASDERDWATQGRLTVTSTRSIFKSRQALVFVDDSSLSQDRFARLLTWQGSENIYSGPFLVIGEEELDLPSSWDFDTWKAFSSETDSAQVTNPFALSDEDLWDRISEPSRLRAVSFLPRPDIGSREDTIGAVLLNPPP